MDDHPERQRSTILRTAASNVWDTPGDTLTFTFNSVTSNPQTTGATNDLEVSRAPDPGDYYTLDDGTFRWKEHYLDLATGTVFQSGISWTDYALRPAVMSVRHAGAAGVIPDVCHGCSRRHIVDALQHDLGSGDCSAYAGM